MLLFLTITMATVISHANKQFTRASELILICFVRDLNFGEGNPYYGL